MNGLVFHIASGQAFLTGLAFRAATSEQTAGAVAGVASLVMVPLVKFRGTDISIRSGPMGNRTFE